MRSLALMVLTAAALLAQAGGAEAQLGSAPLETLSTDGSVNALAVSGRTLYLGGAFSRLGPRTGPWVALDQATGQGAPLPQVSGGGQLVTAVAQDGSGGWYVGGNFTHIGGVARDDLAHVLSNGAIDPGFDPDPTGGGFTDIAAIAVSPSAVYVGGRFSSVGGQKRHNLAALDTTTGLATPWDPSPNNPVMALAVSGTTVYVGGGFNTLAGQTRNGIGAVNAVTGVADPWNPNATAGGGSGGFPTVYTLALAGSTIYAGGAFDSIGGANRPALAALHTTGTGLATSWNPSPSGGLNTSGGHAIVDSVAVSGSTVYAGGDFTTIGGQPRTDLAALSTSGSGQATAFNAHVGGALSAPRGLVVDAVAVSGSTVYAGGSFSAVDGQPRSDLAALNGATGEVTTWNPSPNGTVSALSVAGSLVYAGGDFTAIGGVTRHNLAAIDLPTETVLPWNPGTTGNGGRVDALAVRQGTVFAGGDFTAAGGFPRKHLAAFNSITGVATRWNPGANGSVSALKVLGRRLYVAGSFTRIGGRLRRRIAAVQAGGKVTAWNPDADGPIYSLAASAKTVYAGGSFTTIGGLARARLAALSAKTGRPTNWSVNTNGPVYALALAQRTLYVGGAFGSVAGRRRRLLAAIGARSGKVKGWNPGVRGSFGGPYASVRALSVGGSTVYVGGSFSSVGGLARSDAAAVGRGGGAPTGWDPSPNDYVSALANAGPALVVGGFFTGFELGGQQGIAVFGPG